MSLARMLHRVALRGLGRSRGARRCDIRAHLVVCAARVYTAPVMLLQTAGPQLSAPAPRQKVAQLCGRCVAGLGGRHGLSAPAEPIREVLQNALDSDGPRVPERRSRARRLAELFSARCLERYSWRVDPARVEVLGDVIQALYIGLERFTEPRGVSVDPDTDLPAFPDAPSASARGPHS